MDRQIEDRIVIILKAKDFLKVATLEALQKETPTGSRA
jgi:hypothetical protein